MKRCVALKNVKCSYSGYDIENSEGLPEPLWGLQQNVINYCIRTSRQSIVYDIINKNADYVQSLSISHSSVSLVFSSVSSRSTRFHSADSPLRSKYVWVIM